MTKKTTKKMDPTKNYPMVSVCTPTFNRRPFIQNMFECFRNQDYPKHRIEWIIVDDGTDKIRDLVEASGIHQIRYFEVKDKMNLGAKRNYMHSFVKGSIVVYMDDDDYYPPERISHAVDKLQTNTSALCAGASEIYIYFKHIDKMFQCGPYGPNHATAGTFAFRTELLKRTRYEDTASLAEERAFLKDYTIPFVQLDPMKSILVFSHEHNTFDKRKMLDNMNPQFMKESPKTVDSFIRQKHEKTIKQFFMNEIVGLLQKYEPGLPKMKPDVIKQIGEIEKEREKMIQEHMQKNANNQPVIIQRPGEPPVTLSTPEVVQLLQQQQQVIQQLQAQAAGQGQPPALAQSSQKITDLENLVSMLQKQLIEKTKTIKMLTKELAEERSKDKTSNSPSHSPPDHKEEVKESIEIVEIPVSPPKLAPKSKSDPELVINVSD